MSKEETIEIFLQGEGIPGIQILRVPDNNTVRDLIAKARAITAVPLQEGETLLLFVEDGEDGLNPDAHLKEAGVGH